MGDDTATLSLSTLDDDIVGADGSVTVTLSAGDGYTLGAAATAEVSVASDDTATLAVSATPDEIEEGATSTVTVAITNGKTFDRDRSISLSITGTASDSDHTLAHRTLTLATGGSSATTTLAATDDDLPESSETVIISASLDGEPVGTTTVSIPASDSEQVESGEPRQPGAPRSLGATPDGHSAINLSWLAPAAGGSTIVRYEVQWSDDGERWNNAGRTPDGETLTFEQTGLTFATTRHYRVAARNDVGLGPWSNTATATTLADVPGVPGLSVRGTSTSTIKLTWTVPSANGDPITWYEMESSPNGEENSWTWLSSPSADDTDYTNTGLEPGEEHYYRIRAVNGTGHGAWSGTARAATRPDRPDVPVLNASPVGEDAIDLTWIEPGDRGAAITTYEIQVSMDDSNWSALTTQSAPALSYTHRGMQPGDERGYRMRARNSVGWSGWSGTAVATTLTGVPLAPDLTVSANGASEIRLTWTRPDDRGSEIFLFDIQESDDADEWSLLGNGLPPDRTTHVHSGLTGGTTKHYRIRALNANGNGQWSQTRSATTDAGGPDAPTLTAIAAGERQVHLSWNAPPDNGEPITGYRIERSRDGNEPWERLANGHRTTSYSDTDLFPGITRYYRIAAVNRAGMGTFSSVASATTDGDPPTVPGAPQLLRFSEADRSRVTIAWDPPASDGGAPVTAYRYDVTLPCQDDPTGNCTGMTGTTTDTSATILDLDGDHVFRVRAMNFMGESEWSSRLLGNLRPSVDGRLLVEPTTLDVDEGGTLSYTVRPSTEPTQPIYVALFWEGDYDLTDSLAAQQFQVIVPDGWQQPDHFYQQVHGWTEGVTFTVHAPEDDDRESGAAVIHHYVVTLEADYLGNPEDWTEDPVYQYMQGSSVRVTELDND